MTGKMMYVFHPQGAQVLLSGANATVTMSVDGFEASLTKISGGPVAPRYQPIDLGYDFQDFPSSVPTRHVVVAVLTVSEGRTSSATCSFDLPW